MHIFSNSMQHRLLRNFIYFYVYEILILSISLKIQPIYSLLVNLAYWHECEYTGYIYFGKKEKIIKVYGYLC